MFIVFEGIDGSGKSSQVKLLESFFLLGKIPVHVTCEPTYNFLGSIIREVINKKRKIDGHTLASLFSSDRSDHIHNEEYGLLNYIEKGSVVISDRYYISSLAYNTLYVDFEIVHTINFDNITSLKPDIHIYLDVSVDTALNRIEQTRKHIDLFETREQLEKIQSNYLRAITLLKDTEKIIILDGNQPAEVIHQEIINLPVLAQFL